MKICHITFSLGMGGAETMLVDIVNEQVKTNTVYLVIVNNIISPAVLKRIDSGVCIFLTKRIPASKNPIPLIKVNSIVLKLKPDVIHFHQFNGIKLLFPFLRKRAVLTLHTTGQKCTYLNEYKKIFSISNAVKIDLKDRYELDSTVIYNGITTDIITQKTANTNSNKSFRIVQIGRLKHQIKGQDIVIKAIAEIIKKDSDSKILLDIIGDGSSLDYLKNLVSELNLDLYVRFLGEKDREYIYTHLHDYQLLIQPSLQEGFGLTIAEAMAAKVSVLVSDIRGTMETIGNGNYGYFFKSGDHLDCACQILKLAGNYNNEANFNEANFLLDEAYKYCVKNYSIGATAKKYIENYK